MNLIWNEKIKIDSKTNCNSSRSNVPGEYESTALKARMNTKIPLLSSEWNQFLSRLAVAFSSKPLEVSGIDLSQKLVIELVLVIKV